MSSPQEDLTAMLREVVMHFTDEGGSLLDAYEAVAEIKAEINSALEPFTSIEVPPPDVQPPATLGHFVGLDEEPSHGYWEAGDHG